jgi:hypothetical protein
MYGKRPLGRLKYGYDVIKMDLREVSLSHYGVNESG